MHDKEITVRALMLGVILTLALGASNVYLGLFAGMTISASIPAAVVAMACYRWILRSYAVVESNMVQSMASAGESLAAGIIFTMPALVIAGEWQDFDYIATTAVAFLGGSLGVLLMIPLRRMLIVSRSDLPYPEGVACAEILQSSDSSRGAQRLLVGGLFGALGKIATAPFWSLLPSSLVWAGRYGSHVFYGAVQLSPALLGVGYIVKWRTAIQIFAGGAIGWLILLPFWFYTNTPEDVSAIEAAHMLREDHVRYVGVGAMAAAGILSLGHIVLTFVEAFRAKHKNSEQNFGLDIPLKLRWILLVLFTLGIFVFYSLFIGSWGWGLFLTPILLTLAAVFSAVATYIVALVGSSNSPVSGMTIFILLASGLIFALVGFPAETAMVALLVVAGVACCSVATAGDIAQDLKTGSLVGATPWKQQVFELIGVAVASVIMAPVLTLLHGAYGIGTGGEQALAAPQAALFASLSQALVGASDLPMFEIFMGAAIALAIFLLNFITQKFIPLYPMAIGVGLYLPLALSATVALGGLARFLHEISGMTNRFKSNDGVLVASGLVAGEALAGIGIAIYLMS